MCNEVHIDSLVRAAKRVRLLALKPRQRVGLIFKYLVPKFLFKWGIDLPGLTKLKGLDTELRVIVREVLHLHPSTASSLFYLKCRDGGLGLPKLGRLMRISALRTGVSMLNSTDNVQRAIVLQSDVERFLSKTASNFNLRWPLNDKDIKSLKSLTNREAQAELKDLKAQGATAECFKNDPLSNEWLHNDSLLGSWEYSNAIRLRSDTMGTRVAMARKNPSIDKKCRRCWLKNESLGHIHGLKDQSTQ
jgi:hypothetical protein